MLWSGTREMRPLGNDLFFIEKSFSGFLARTDNAKIGIRYGVSGQFQLVPRNEAKVSVFDSNFLIGDGIWVGSISNLESLPRLLIRKFRKAYEYTTVVCNSVVNTSIDCSNPRKQWQ